MATVSGKVYKCDGSSVYPNRQHMRWYKYSGGSWVKVYEFDTGVYGKYGPVDIQEATYRVCINPTSGAGGVNTCRAIVPVNGQVVIDAPVMENVDFWRGCYEDGTACSKLPLAVSGQVLKCDWSPVTEPQRMRWYLRVKSEWVLAADILTTPRGRYGRLAMPLGIYRVCINPVAERGGPDVCRALDPPNGEVTLDRPGMVVNLRRGCFEDGRRCPHKDTSTVSGQVFENDGGSVYPYAQYMRWYKYNGSSWVLAYGFSTGVYGKYGPRTMTQATYRVCINPTDGSGGVNTCRAADPPNGQVVIDVAAMEDVDFRRGCDEAGNPPGLGGKQCACAKPPRTKRKPAKK